MSSNRRRRPITSPRSNSGIMPSIRFSGAQQRTNTRISGPSSSGEGLGVDPMSPLPPSSGDAEEQPEYAPYLMNSTDLSQHSVVSQPSSPTTVRRHARGRRVSTGDGEPDERTPLIGGRHSRSRIRSHHAAGSEEPWTGRLSRNASYTGSLLAPCYPTAVLLGPTGATTPPS